MELLNDIEHVTFDLASFVTHQDLVLRIFTLIGQVCSVSAVSLPDHKVTEHEFLFQTLMLGVSTTHLSRSAVPLFNALLKPTSLRDHFAYCLFFRPKRLSWIQYKILLTAMTWVDIPPHTDIHTKNKEMEDLSKPCNTLETRSKCQHTDESFVYWIYSGDVIFNFNNGSMVYEMNRRHGKCKNDQHDFGLIGDTEFSQVLNKKTYYKNDNTYETGFQGKYKTSHKGATVLQLNTIKLMELMDNDENVDKSIRSMLLDSMQSKATI